MSHSSEDNFPLIVDVARELYYARIRMVNWFLGFELTDWEKLTSKEKSGWYDEATKLIHQFELDLEKCDCILREFYIKWNKTTL